MKNLSRFPLKLLATQTLAVMAVAWNPFTVSSSFAANTVTENGTTTTFADAGWNGGVKAQNGRNLEFHFNVAEASIGNKNNLEEVAFLVGGDHLGTSSEKSGKVVAYFDGENQKIYGATESSGQEATFELTSSKDNFKVVGGQVQEGQLVMLGGRPPLAFEARQKATNTLTFEGANVEIDGNITSSSGGTNTLHFKQDVKLVGDVLIAIDRNYRIEQIEREEKSVPSATFDGNVTAKGLFQAGGQDGVMTLNFHGEKNVIEGNLVSRSMGQTSWPSENTIFIADVDNNTLTATFDGTTSLKGQIVTYGGSTLTATFKGKNNDLTQKGDGSYSNLIHNGGGTMTLKFLEKSSLYGKIENTFAKGRNGLLTKQPDGSYTVADESQNYYHPGTLDILMNDSRLDGSFTNKGTSAKLTMTGASSWYGDLVSNSVQANNLLDVQLQGTTKWASGNFSNTDGIAQLTLTESAQWTGNLRADYAVKPENSSTVYLKDDSYWKGFATGKGNVHILDSARWDLTSNSSVELLEMEGNSLVSLKGSARKLTTGDLKGNGLILMDLAYSDNAIETYRDGTTSDFIIVQPGEGKKATSGATYTIVASNESKFDNFAKDNKLFFATAPADSTTFAVGTTRIEIPNYKSLFNDLKAYRVDKETDATDTDFKGYENWYLTPIDVPSIDPEPKPQPEPGEDPQPQPEPEPEPQPEPNENQVVNPNGLVPTPALSAALSIWRDNDTLVKRLGDLPLVNRGEYASGSWVRFAHQKTERSAGENAFKAPFDRVQLGYDFQLNPTWFLGASYGYGWGDFDYGAGEGKLHSNELTVYATNVRENGHTWDFVARVGRLSSEYTTNYGDKAKFKNWAASLGVEYGKRFDVTERFALEPQAQLTYHRLWGDEYTSRYGITVNQDNVDSLVGRIGVLASYSWSGTDRAGRVYAKASVLHDFKADTSNTIAQDAQITRSDDLSDTWYVVGVGTNVKLGSAWQLYADLETGLAATVKTKYNINAGVRYTF